MLDNFDIWNFIVKVVDSFLLTYIPYRIFPARAFVKNRHVAFLLSFFVASVIIYGIDMVFKPVDFLYTLALCITVGIVYVQLFYQGRLYLKMIVQCACVCCTMVAHFATVTTLTFLTGTFALFSWMHAFTVMILQAILVYFMIRFTYIPKMKLPPHYGSGMVALMLIMAFGTNTFMMMGGNVGLSSFSFRLGMVLPTMLSALFVYYFFFSLVKEFEQNKLTAQHLEMHKKHTEELTEAFNSMRHMRHEIKNHVFTLNNLLERNDYEHLKRYFNQVYQKEYSINLVESGNNMVDAVLNQKVAYAKSKNIRISVSASLPESPDIDESHICAVISNLLDNAVEACEKVPSPDIMITVQQKGKYIHILCQNTAAADVCRDNPDLRTTKHCGNHGIGMQIIRKVVEEYDGMIDFRMDGMMFVVTLMLKVKDTV